MLKRIALSLALVTGAAVLPVAAQAQECYRPHRVVDFGYRRAPFVVYAAPFYRPPVVVYREPAVPVYPGPIGWRDRDWRAREWRHDYRGPRHGYR
jgi:hypothetical protein